MRLHPLVYALLTSLALWAVAFAAIWQAVN